MGYGYDKFLRMITTNLPNWIDKAVTAYIEKTYGVSVGKEPYEEDVDEVEYKI